MYKTIILFTALCKYETLLLTLEERYKLREFEDRVPREVYLSKTEKVRGEWGTLPRQDYDFILLLTQCYWGDKIKEDKKDEACSTLRVKKNAGFWRETKERQHLGD